MQLTAQLAHHKEQSYMISLCDLYDSTQALRYQKLRRACLTVIGNL